MTKESFLPTLTQRGEVKIPAEDLGAGDIGWTVRVVLFRSKLLFTIFDGTGKARTYREWNAEEGPDSTWESIAKLLSDTMIEHITGMKAPSPN